jgi:hypothetical protein
LIVGEGAVGAALHDLDIAKRCFDIFQKDHGVPLLFGADAFRAPDNGDENSLGIGQGE